MNVREPRFARDVTAVAQTLILEKSGNVSEAQRA